MKLICRTLALTVPAALAASLCFPNLGWAQRFKELTEADLRAMQPASPNPYLAFLPEDVEPDFAYWYARMKIDAVKRGQQRALSPALAVAVDEEEPNDTPGSAMELDGFGFGPGQATEVDLSGSAGPQGTPFSTAAEDNGAIPLATSGFGLTDGTRFVTTSTIGNGPHGSGGTGTGDFDFVELPGLDVGDVVTVDIATPFGGVAGLDSYLTIFDSAGSVIAANDDENFPLTLDSFVEFTVPTPGTYYVCVGSFLSQAPADPFDSSTGPGSFSEGDYTLIIGVNVPPVSDPDFFSFNLTPGDVLGIDAANTAQLSLFESASGDLMVASALDASGIYPPGSPLPGGSGVALAFVAREAGEYVLRVDGTPAVPYTAALRLFRPGLEAAAAGTKQILFVDFDGATVNLSDFGGPNFLANLSPLSAFLAGWGLGPEDEDDVIDAILAVVEENVRTDLLAGANPNFDVEIRNSRDHADPFGQANVSRLVVGGSIAEFGVLTIGLAQSIDPGNFETAETAVVLLDLLSADASDPNSLSQFPLAAGATIVDVIAAGVGNITAHEAGHYLGNFHTDQFNPSPNIMDQGGNLANTVGVGNDGIFGSADDTDVDFGEDTYVPNEGFAGTEDTLNVVAFALSMFPSAVTNVYVNFTAVVNGTGTFENPFNNLTDAVDTVQSGGTIRIFPGLSSETFAGPAAINRPITLINESPGGGAVIVGAP